MLHITNGDSAANSLANSGLLGEILPWRDILHEGPVPAGLTLERMCEVRCRFLADIGWATENQALEGFVQRNQTLAAFRAHDEVVLWFEHDLFDQLQIVQILAWFSRQSLGQTRLSLICIDRYPGLPRFRGLGELTPAQLVPLFPGRQRVSVEQLLHARDAWEAFTAPTPMPLCSLIDQSAAPLPFLRAAMLRHLEQYPALKTGLARTERQILAIVVEGICHPVPIFVEDQVRESAPFLGDVPFWHHVRNLCRCEQPLLMLSDGRMFQTSDECRESGRDFATQVLDLTSTGRDVLAGRADFVALNGIDRWLGGVHLAGHKVAWRWDATLGRVVPCTA